MAIAHTGEQQYKHLEQFVEVDPTGRYGRYNEILGKGSSKTVYRGFDEYEGIEVAWNQVKLHDFLQSPEELERLYCEIHLLKTLKHKNIMKFYTSWVDTSNRNINFVTEMFTSGTLRQYRQKHRKVNIRAVKNWCRQILNGLLYLHSHDPPVIHRDLKCDNIFINGNQGQVKIGDLGLAAILRKSHAARCVGTPEFMAPEVYQEQYNELVDIYSFGMCILEMVTFEYPYSECTHPAQIYKKVISGTKPDALYKVEDPGVRQFVEKCLATVSQRLPAGELLKDPFLQIDDVSPSSRGEVMAYDLSSIVKQPSLGTLPINGYLIVNGITNKALENGWEQNDVEAACGEIEIFSNQETEHSPNVDITIKGRRKTDGSIYLKLRISDKEGRRRNIHFPFDTEADTALSVATEMVGELDIVDFDVMSIAEMIDGEVASLVPEWKPGPVFDEPLGSVTPAFCDNCASAVTSYGSLAEILSGKNPGNLPGLQCSRTGCMHGRFAEITYQIEKLQQQREEESSLPSSRPDSPEVISQVPLDDQPASDNERASPSSSEKALDDNHDVEVLTPQTMERSSSSGSISEQLIDSPESDCQHCTPVSGDEYESEIQQELRWLKSKYQLELREYMNQRLAGAGNPVFRFTAHDTRQTCSSTEMSKQLNVERELSSCFPNNEIEPSHSGTSIQSESHQESYRNFYDAMECHGNHSLSINNAECVFNAKNFHALTLLPGCLNRTKSLPVDAIDS